MHILLFFAAIGLNINHSTLASFLLTYYVNVLIHASNLIECRMQPSAGEARDLILSFAGTAYSTALLLLPKFTKIVKAITKLL